MGSVGKPFETTTRVITSVLMLLIVLFVLQMLVIQHTGWKIALSVVLVVAMAGAIGWLAAALRGGHQDSAGHE